MDSHVISSLHLIIQGPPDRYGYSKMMTRTGTRFTGLGFPPATMLLFLFWKLLELLD